MGHISPNIALLPHLSKSYNEIHYIGSKNGIEKTKIKEEIQKGAKIIYHEIPSTKLNRKSVFKNLLIPFVLISAISKSKKLLREINPDVVFSKGGYVSVPVCFAAKKTKTPLVIHESDLSMGLANSLAAKKATTVCTTFPETAKKHINGVWTGSPVGNKILFADKQNTMRKYNLNPNLKTITITGGSLGSTAINDAILKILPALTKKYNVIHLTGKNKKINFAHPNYHQEEFTSDIGEIFKSSDLVISRAGSNTIFELALLKVPMLLIPLSKKASRGDQIENAEYFKKLGIAYVLEEENLNSLNDSIETSIKNLQSIKINLHKTNFTNGLEKLLSEINKASLKR